jgi:DNA (cytosine-5)-methyltransferase 1
MQYPKPSTTRTKKTKKTKASGPSMEAASREVAQPIGSTQNATTQVVSLPEDMPLTLDAIRKALPPLTTATGKDVVEGIAPAVVGKQKQRAAKEAVALPVVDPRTDCEDVQEWAAFPSTRLETTASSIAPTARRRGEIGMPRAYYNEIDPQAAHWLRNLITAGQIAPGDVDERDVREVEPDDLSGYTQCHFFAGIGIWSGAMRLAGLADEYPAWTASCPCQSFSTAGAGLGKADERHLWPYVARLAFARRPPVIFGEQVASPAALDWLDDVLDELQMAHYETGVVDSCAAGIGAPHIRQRLYWAGIDRAATARLARRGDGCNDAVDDTVRPRLERFARMLDDGNESGRLTPHPAGSSRSAGPIGGMADAAACRRMPGIGHAVARRNELDAQGRGEAVGVGHDGRPGPLNGLWRDADWLFCRDGRWRPVRPGSFPLADGDSSRVGRLRAYGNAIVMPQAAAFVRSIIDFTDAA